MAPAASSALTIAHLTLDEAIGNEASLARMTAIAAVETVCYQLARAAGEVDNLGLPPPKKDD